MSYVPSLIAVTLHFCGSPLRLAGPGEPYECGYQHGWLLVSFWSPKGSPYDEPGRGIMLPSDTVEEGLWNAITKAPEDEVPRLILADWLEERNDPRAPLLRERRYSPYLNANCRDAVQVVLAILDGGPASSLKPLLQAAALVGAPLVPGLLERCRATP